MRKSLSILWSVAAVAAAFAWIACGSDDSPAPAASGGSGGSLEAGLEGGDAEAGPGGTGGSSEAGPDSNGGTAGSPDDAAMEAEAGPKHAAPPGPGTQKEGDGTSALAFAVSKWYLGDTDRNGATNEDAWKQYGFDLDGKLSTATSTDLCQPLAGAPGSTVYPDGDDGIDNSFGKMVVPIFNGLMSNLTQSVNDSLMAGTGRIVIEIQKLGTSSDYNPLASSIYQGADLGTAPKYDGTDQWPVMPESLVNPTDITQAKIQLPTAYLTSNTWVGTPAFSVSIVIPMGGAQFTLPIEHAVIAMQFDTTHKTATMGTLAGVIPLDQLLAAVTKFAATFSPSFCDPNSSTVQGLLSEISQAADILSDGTQDPTKSCDGISIGLGFDASAIKIEGIAPPTPPPADPCAG